MSVAKESNIVLSSENNSDLLDIDQSILPTCDQIQSIPENQKIVDNGLEENREESKEREVEVS